MLKTILVPLDGSETSEQAVAFAEGLAGAAGADLILMRTVLPPLAFTPGEDEFVRAQTARAERELDRIRQRLADAGVHAESYVLPGSAADAIVNAATRLRADVIVMSTHGRTGVGRAIYGSVADEVVRSATVPVLLVRPGLKYRLNPPSKVVVPLDGSEIAEAALAPAIELAQALRVSVVLVRAAEAPIYWVEEESGARTAAPGSEAEAARRYLDAVADRYASAGIVFTGYVTDVAPEEAIIGAAEDYGAGAIAMATHGRSGFARAALGSVAEQVLGRATTPVLLVNARLAASARDGRLGEMVADATLPARRMPS